MLVAGDFNSTPGSAAHALLVSGHVDASFKVRALAVCRFRDALAMALPPEACMRQKPCSAA
jgi:hypothetical protein